MSLFAFSDPWYDLHDMQRTMDRLMDHLNGNQNELVGPAKSASDNEKATAPLRRQVQLSRWTPQVDVKETENTFVVHAELPGCNKEDIKLSIEQNRLVLQGEKRTHQKEKGDNWVWKERFEGSFVRTLALPRGVDPNNIQANYTNGVLEVVIPKPQDQQPKQHVIEIKTVEDKSE